MTAAATSAASRISRCAVCKIDRKGRFVYLDEETEKLLGYSQVEIFAKPFSEFLDPSDHELIDEICSQFNRYETFYDAAAVTIIDSQGRRIPATVVVSLNFAAGNPVNYEIIIHVTEPGGEVQREIVEDNTAAKFLDYLFDARLPSESPEAASAMADALLEYTGATAVGLFATSGESPQLIASSGMNSGDEFEINGTAESDPRQYFKALLEFPGSEECLLKIAFDESWPEDRLAEARRRAGTATDLLSRTLRTISEEEPAYNSADTFSIIELLDRMCIGAALFDSEKHLVDHNRQLHEMLPVDSVTSLEAFAAKVAEAGNSEAPEHIRAYFDAGKAGSTPLDFELLVSLSSGRSACLNIFRLAPESEDMSAYCLLTPCEPDGGRSVKQLSGLSRRFIRQAIEQLNSSVSAGLAVCRRLDHEFHSELTGDGSFHLNCLANHLQKSSSVVNKLKKSAAFAREPEEASPTDLTRLVEHLLPDIEKNYPGVKLSFSYSNLPKVTVCRRKLGTVLKNIFKHLAAHAIGQELGINVSAAVNPKECHVRIKCEGAAIPQKHLENAFDPDGLGVTRELVSLIGGRLELIKSRGRGSVLMVSFPIQER